MFFAFQFQPLQLLVDFVVHHFLFGRFVHFDESVCQTRCWTWTVRFPHTSHCTFNEFTGWWNDFRFNGENAVHYFQNYQLFRLDFVFHVFNLLIPYLTAPLAFHVAVDARVMRLLQCLFGFLGLFCFLCLCWCQWSCSFCSCCCCCCSCRSSGSSCSACGCCSLCCLCLSSSNWILLS